MNVQKQKLVFRVLIALSLIPVTICYSDDFHSSSNDDHSHHGREIEYGMSFEYSFLDEGIEDEEEHEDELDHEQHDNTEFVPGLHLHVTKRLSREGFQKYLGLGLGGEILFTEDPHYGLMGSLAIYPWRELVLAISPGIEFATHEGIHEREFAMHYELNYGFKVNDLHIGPSIGFAHTRDSEHYSAGIHIGF